MTPSSDTAGPAIMPEMFEAGAARLADALARCQEAREAAEAKVESQAQRIEEIGGALEKARTDIVTVRKRMGAVTDSWIARCRDLESAPLRLYEGEAVSERKPSYTAGAELDFALERYERAAAELASRARRHGMPFECRGADEIEDWADEYVRQSGYVRSAPLPPTGGGG